MELDGKNIAILMADDYEDLEFWYPYYRMKEAGADVIFVEAPRTVEEMQKICKVIKAPHLANMVEGGGKTPILPLSKLKEIGYKIVIYPASAWMASIKAIQEVLSVLKEDGNTSRYAAHMVSFHDMFEVVGRSKFVQLEKKYCNY